VNGRRVDDETEPHTYEPGDYGRWRGMWWVRPPQNGEGRSATGCIKLHTVTEHEDRTITVAPSIRQMYGDGEELWHGFLERGVWRSC
jgi:hypothetical protein